MSESHERGCRQNFDGKLRSIYNVSNTLRPNAFSNQVVSEINILTKHFTDDD